LFHLIKVHSLISPSDFFAVLLLLTPERHIGVSFPVSLAPSGLNLHYNHRPRARACRNAQHSLGVRSPGILRGQRQLMSAHSFHYTLSLFTNILNYSFFCKRILQGTRILEFLLLRICRGCLVSSHNLLMRFKIKCVPAGTFCYFPSARHYLQFISSFSC